MISLHLFGTFLATDDNRPITTFRSSRARALLAYLAVESRTPLLRDRLATLLWSDMSDERARRNLSLTLTRLQHALDSYTPKSAERLFSNTPQTLHLTAETELWCDVLELDHHLTTVAAHSHISLHTCTTCLAHLEGALQLYQGDFLSGFAVEDAPLFEEWRTFTRESYHQKVMGALNLLTESALERRDYNRAIGYAQQQLVLEPWLEQAHYQYMLALAYKGERSKALYQFEICRTRLAEEFGVAPSENVRALYEQLQNGAEIFHSEPSHHNTSPYLGAHTLPLALNRFFGREQEQIQLENLLTDADVRLVTVLSNGGMGKTRIAVKVGHTVRDQFPDGVWFVSLVGVEADGEKEARAALVRAIYEVLPLVIRPNISPEQMLIASLRSQHLLLILDNMEQLRQGATLITDLLRGSPHLTVLCTSRAPLKLQAEWLFALDGLPVPPFSPSQHVTEESLASIPASIELFVARARQTVPTFTLTAENRVHLIAICASISGSPLGIELAAAMMRYRSPQMLATALRHSLDAVYTEQRDIEARHRSLRTIFTSSWDLLDAAEQHVLSLLSLFHAPFEAESAAAISGATLVHLDALLDHSLLATTEHDHYILHVLVREYAAERLVASGEYERAHTRYRHYFLGLLSDQYPALIGMKPHSAMEGLHNVMADIRTAWNGAVARGEVALLARVLPSLTRYLTMSDRIIGAGIAFEQDAISLTNTLGYVDTATVALIGELWVAAARTTLSRAPLDTLLTVGETICQLGQRIASLTLEAHGWRVQGQAHLIKGSTEQSLFYLDRALELARRSEDTPLLILCLATYRTPLEAQRANAKEALTLATSIDDGWTIAGLHVNLGGAYYFDGALMQAREAFRLAIAYYEQSGHRRQLATMLNNMGDLHRVLGQYEHAHNLHRAALQTAQQIGDRWNEQSVLEGMARYYRDLGELIKARELVQRAIAIVTKIDIITSVAYHYNLLGLIALEEGAWEEAEQAFKDAIHLSSDGGHHSVRMESYAGMARLAEVRGQKQDIAVWVGAIAEFILSGQSLGSYGDTPFIYWTCYELLKQIQDPRALLVLERAYADFASISATLLTPDEVALFWRVPYRSRLREDALHLASSFKNKLYVVPKVS